MSHDDDTDSAVQRIVELQPYLEELLKRYDDDDLENAIIAIASFALYEMNASFGPQAALDLAQALCDRAPYLSEEQNKKYDA